MNREGEGGCLNQFSSILEAEERFQDRKSSETIALLRKVVGYFSTKIRLWKTGIYSDYEYRVFNDQVVRVQDSGMLA